VERLRQGVNKMLEGLTVDNSPLKGRHRTHGFQRRTPDTTEERIEENGNGQESCVAD
jgi:hypothetical protein